MVSCARAVVITSGVAQAEGDNLSGLDGFQVESTPEAMALVQKPKPLAPDSHRHAAWHRDWIAGPNQLDDSLAIGWQWLPASLSDASAAIHQPVVDGWNRTTGIESGWPALKPSRVCVAAVVTENSLLY